MLGIVRVALKRPYTFVVLALLVLIVGPLAAIRTPTDIFPDIRIPVISVVWQYTGLPPDQMAGRITFAVRAHAHHHGQRRPAHRSGIDRRLRHHQDFLPSPGVNISNANAQVTAVSQTLLKQLPPGATPPLILNYNASTVPIIQLALSGNGLSEQQLGDIGLNALRPFLTTVAGASIPYPFGGKSRQVQIDINPSALQAYGLSAQDVANALAGQNLITPDWHAKDRLVRIHDAVEQCAVRNPGAQQSADQDGERHERVHPRRGDSARRLAAADQHRARGRQPLGYC